MFQSRRQFLAIAGNAFIAGIAGRGSSDAASLPPAVPQFDVDRILLSSVRPGGTVFARHYVASATVTLLSFPIVSRSGVGSGYTVIEQSAGDTGKITSIQFGAGSWPENARGLNRLGYIQESILESSAGQGAECAYLAFMTSSKENNIDQAKKALETPVGDVPYSAAQGYSGHGRVSSRVDQLSFPSRFTWRHITSLVEQARKGMAAKTDPQKQLSLVKGDNSSPGTFLYVLRGAMLDPAKTTTSHLFFNSKQFLLQTDKEADAGAGAAFAGKKLAARADDVIRMTSTLTDRHTGEKTRFRLWYEKGQEHMPPLRFDYQAKSFLRLTFEAAAETDPAVPVPPVRLAFTDKKENS